MNRACGSLRFRCELLRNHPRPCSALPGHALLRAVSTAKASPELLKRKIKSWTLPQGRLVDNGDGICAAYCISAPLSLAKVMDHFQSDEFSAIADANSPALKTDGLTLISRDVVHMPFHISDDPSARRGHAFFFRSGASVFWGLPMVMRRQLLDIVGAFQELTAVKPLSRPRGKLPRGTLPIPMEEFDHEFAYTIDTSRGSSSFKNDRIYLSNFDDPQQLLALSYGLAQSVELQVFEEVVDSLVLRTRTLPDELARKGRIRLSQRELKRLIGELLAARYSVNLVSDILDTPEYFWKHAELENLHLECAREVELRQRARILDTRTQVIKDALDILNNELSSSSSDRVERAILFLIAVEVSIEVARLASAAIQF